MSFRIEEHRELTQVTTQQDTALGIMRWGRNNTFPQTLKNLIEQSPTAKPAVKRTAKFYEGAEFDGSDAVVSPYGMTLKDVVQILAEDYAIFEAFAIHCNYNIEGKVTGINPLRIEDLRFNEFDELNYASKLGYHENFGRNSEVRKTIVNTVTREKISWFNRFNPDVAVKQIEKLGDGESEMAKLTSGINKFKGQVLYHSGSGHSSYPVPPLQAPINYVLSDIENSILVRKETSTGFINSYLLKTSMDAEDPTLIALEDAIDDAQGARGNGKIITMSNMSPDEMNATVLEEIGAGANGSKTIIEAATSAFDLNQRVIHGAYLIPPILAGDSSDTGFSEPDLRDAYFVFNSITQNGRDTIEAQLNRILKNGTFEVDSIQLKKLQLDTDDDQKEQEDKEAKK